MTLPEPDDDLRARFRELREEEEAHAPSFERIRRARPGNSTTGFWLQPVWAMAAAVMLVLGGGWWAASRHGDALSHPAPLASRSEVIETPAVAFRSEDEWATATDSLLADADGAAAAPTVERLTQEIAALLQL